MKKIKRLKLSIVACLLVLIFKNLSIPTIAEAVTNCDVSSPLLTQTSQEAILVGLVNNYRQQNNLYALSWSGTLKKSAAWLSQDMSTHITLNHTDSLGRDAKTRITDCGYNFISYGENIANGSTSAQAIFDMWKNSPTHNAIMLDQSIKEVGISSVNSYWTLDAGSSNTALPTSSPTVTQPISATTTPGISPIATIPPSTPTPSPTPSIITDPTDTTVEVSIQLNGIGLSGNKSPKHLTRLTTIAVFDQTNKKILNGNGYLKYDGKNLFKGVIHLGQLADDTYLIKVASNYTLVSLVIPEFQNLTSSSLNILPAVPLTQGDLNMNNVIDINDYTLALPCFQYNSCQTKDTIDFNDDGKADVIDYNLLLSAFRQYTGD